MANLDDFEQLQARGQAAFEEGRIADAIQILEQALEQARSRGDQRQIDRAFCNLTSVRIALGEGAPLDAATSNRLREILMANEDLTNSWLAAYNLGRSFEYKKENRKGLFYARIALDRAEHLARRDWISASHNQIGNFLLAESFFEQAADEYDQALQGYPAASEGRRALVLGNLGYCNVARGLVRPGLDLLYRSLRVLRRVGREADLAVAHNDLCYAHLELGRVRDAMRHAAKAVALAERCQADDVLKNALFLMGTAVNQSGQAATAAGYFQRLQQSYYPESPFVAELLMHVDVRRMINLRAS